MPRKTNLSSDKRSRRGRPATRERRPPRPKPKVDFTAAALDFKNTISPAVCDRPGTDSPPKYTGLPSHYQSRLNRRIKRGRQMY
jgi:ribosomal protein S18